MKKTNKMRIAAKLAARNMRKKSKKPEKLSIQKICAEIYKHKDTIGRQDISDLLGVIDDARFDWARREAVDHVVGAAESLIHDSSPDGWDRESKDHKTLDRAARHLVKKLPATLREKVWNWR